jgi:hypothetical protein
MAQAEAPQNAGDLFEGLGSEHDGELDSASGNEGTIQAHTPEGTQVEVRVCGKVAPTSY